MTKPPQGPEPEKKPRRLSFWYLLLVLWLAYFLSGWFQDLSVQGITYSEFKDMLAEGRVTECAIGEDSIRGKASEATGPEPLPAESPPPDDKSASEVRPLPREAFAFETIPVDDPDLIKQLEAARVKYTGARPDPFWQFIGLWILPLLLLVALWFFLFRSMGPMGKRAMGFGKSKARIVADNSIDVRFTDVAGCDEAKEELSEVVSFLKEPDRFSALGAHIPKGVLLVGPPGTGKTLMARAVAGEAGVPFFSISGSEFVEMFVGVGAARVRDLFEQAKEKAPCIVFIDEIDAIGRQRGVQMGAVNDEREQTLNQLLAEVDGFEPNAGVILLAATNRPDVLDQALLRPGRFDRQVVLDAPDLVGREAILQVHVQGKPIAKEVDLRKLARATPGFSGADLRNTVNEAALLAARRDAKEIVQKDLEDAIEKVVAGPERKSRRLNDDDKRRVAYHEVGHALVAIHSEHGDTVQKISIVPRGRAALGYTLQLPDQEQYLMTRDELMDRIRGLLGGRAAEEVVFGNVSTGAQDDLERATALARRMVCVFGMSDELGLMTCARREGGQYLNQGDSSLQRDCSEETARRIDEVVSALLAGAYRDAQETLQSHRDQLENVAATLLAKETLEHNELMRLLDLEPKVDPAPSTAPQPS